MRDVGPEPHYGQRAVGMTARQEEPRFCRIGLSSVICLSRGALSPPVLAALPHQVASRVKQSGYGVEAVGLELKLMVNACNFGTASHFPTPAPLSGLWPTEDSNILLAAHYSETRRRATVVASFSVLAGNLTTRIPHCFTSCFLPSQLFNINHNATG